MGKSKLLQEIRMMQFEQLYGNWQAKRLSEEEAAELLGISTRTFRRWSRKFEADGADGLADKRLETPSNRAAPVDEVTEMLAVFETKYQDFNIKHFHEKWVDNHAGARSYDWVKCHLHSANLVLPKKERGPYRKKRPRKPIPGMMLHQDGSTHYWVPTEQWDLIVTMDDATSEIYSAFFIDEEGTWSTFQALKEVITKCGLFCLLYADRGSHYWNTRIAGGKVNDETSTQVHRALTHLGIQLIAAYSPEARGRSERTFGTIQGRLPQELALEGITDMATANRYLKEIFIPDFNKRFTVSAQEEGSAFVPWFNTPDIDDILCIQNTRTVNKDNTIKYNKKILQLEKSAAGGCYAKSKVTVREYSDGNLALFYGPRCIGMFNNDSSSVSSETGDHAELALAGK